MAISAARANQACSCLSAQMSKLNVHIYPSTLTHESRVMRITAAMAELSTFDQILLVGMNYPSLPARERLDAKREIIRLGPVYSTAQGFFGKALRVLSWYLTVLLHFWSQPVACINCRSLSSLPLCVVLKLVTGARLVYDTHELETETPTMHGIRHAMARVAERLFIGFADALIVVGPAIAQWYRQHYSWTNPRVVRNLPDGSLNGVRGNLLREKLPIPDDAVIFLYEGQLCPGRGIEAILDAFMRAPVDRHVVLLGFGPYEKLIEEHSKRFQNIHFLPAVPESELRQYTMSGNIGLCLIEPTCLSYTYSLPNKLFEYLGAGVPVIASRLPDLSLIVETSGAGWLVDGTADQILMLVTSITSSEVQIRSRKAAVWSNANSWLQECEVLRTLYRDLGFA